MLVKFKTLIENLPVRNVSFPTKRSTWANAETKYDWLQSINQEFFKDKQILEVSRKDIFQNNLNIRETIILTLYWGYPQGMRGNHFVNILGKIDDLEEALMILKNSDNCSIDDYISFKGKIKNIEGLALSTFSKLLYFLEIKINGYECLILDQRLIDAISRDVYSQFSEIMPLRYGANAEKKYPQFLELTSKISEELDFKAENLEMFLFTFGKNLQA